MGGVGGGGWNGCYFEERIADGCTKGDAGESFILQVSGCGGVDIPACLLKLCNENLLSEQVVGKCSVCALRETNTVLLQSVIVVMLLYSRPFIQGGYRSLET